MNIKNNSPLIIDIERCKGCELCIFYCPKKCLSKSTSLNKLGHNPVELVNAAECNSCGICYLICPDYAITVL